MDPLKTLIVDDEPLAREILEEYVNRIPDCIIVASCRTALEAFGILSTQPVDLLLLDINMPELSGIELLKTLKNPPPVIFTTAYAEFALESYNHDAFDYLLKPIPFNRFLRAIDKVKNARAVSFHRYNTDAVTNAVVNALMPAIILVKSEGKLVKIVLSELLFVEGLKDYLKLWTTSGMFVIYGTMRYMEERLKGRSDFIRVNKSYIINMNSIREVAGNIIRIKEHEIPIGNTYWTEISGIFSKLRF